MLQRLPVVAEEVKVVFPPAQKLLFPEMEGVVGKGVSVTPNTLLTALVHVPEITLTEKLPAFETVIVLVVAPLLHKFPVVAEEVKVVFPPAQKLLFPEMVGVVGKGDSVTPKALLTVLVHVPEITLNE